METLPSRKAYGVQLEPELPPEPSVAGSAAEIGSIPEPRPLPEQPASSQHAASSTAQANAPGVFTPPQRASSYAGAWKANTGSSSCRIQLSSVPSLDLYKASAQGCSDTALKTVNGWSFRDEQVVLFSRGQVIARLSGAEAALAGTLSGSKADLTMTR
ncbi:AprI/Inh family metalloprotease inhibitor [Microvirga sp. BT689]|uniref:AprI/Inh family metalloprotease inhibitor n=1 Tax=Microvirga arvi TaxID=2778731 RepID=UPI00194DEE07|nr:AprI/Inh family metalloprotease inhibitor [Microvirga arvi]MBM6580021.1 AprI/Inh family metalloprotease inhibitor [Microvirga arvi]